MEPMTLPEYDALTDEQRLTIINQLAVGIPNTVEMELDTLRVILRNVADALSIGNLALAASSITDIIKFKTELSDSPKEADGISPVTGMAQFFVDAFITHQDGSRD